MQLESDISGIGKQNTADHLHKNYNLCITADDKIRQHNKIADRCQGQFIMSSSSFVQKLVHVLTDDVAQTVAYSTVASRLDYCNALLSGAPAATFDKLQRAQNNLARVVCQSRGRTDGRPLLHSLHWHPVRQRVTYKLAVLTHKV